MSMNQKKVKIMTMNDIDLKEAQETQYALNQAKHIDQNKTEFWLWSDIAQIHSSFLNKDNLIATDYFHKNLQHAVFEVLPEYHDMFPKPVHVKSVSNQKLNETDSPDMEKNLDHQMTRVGCEFFFQKFDNSPLSQTYFLFPEKSVKELSHLSDEISIYHEAKKIQNITKILVAVVAYKTIDFDKKQTFAKIWNTLWTELFGTTDIEQLKNKYSIKNSPTTHLIPNYWMYVRYMLQDCKNYIDTHEMLTSEEVIEQCRESAQIQRHMIEKHTEQKPEDLLTTTDFKETVKKIEEARKDLWLCYYPKSLKQW